MKLLKINHLKRPVCTSQWLKGFAIVLTLLVTSHFSVIGGESKVLSFIDTVLLIEDITVGCTASKTLIKVLIGASTNQSAGVTVFSTEDEDEYLAQSQQSWHLKSLQRPELSYKKKLQDGCDWQAIWQNVASGN